MSYLINNQQKMTEIVFAGRNKNYGAYVIRSAYGNTLLRSLLIVISGFGTFALIAYYMSNRSETNLLPNEQIIPTVPVHTTLVKITPKKLTSDCNLLSKKELPKNPQTKGALTVVDSTAEKAKDIKPSELEPVITNSALASPGAAGSGSAVASGATTTTTGGEEKIKRPYNVDSNPEFEGGMGALLKFLSSNIRYPALASEAGKEATVYIEFVVDETGHVSDLHLQNKSGFGFDEEALRVVGMIPKFKTPAMADGKPVSVYYNLPIKFRMR